MENNSEVEININKYKEIIDDEYSLSYVRDNEMGLKYTPEKKSINSFCFKVIDINRFLLAKIKYNI